MTGDSTGRRPARPGPFTPRPRSDGATGPARPSAREQLAAELDKIERRLQHVEMRGRDSFAEGSESFDRATVAVLRLAALFEDEKTFAPLLESATEVERRGIAHTRNIAAHVGYATMDEDTFWVTATQHMPAFIAKVRAANSL
ncbi:antitoxin [Isoptericola sp. BMS4]|uniref:antitoxin n=1 Tax=Isoptericola sp. BMS4 TaxID=2527875 RepID=UPI001423C4EE|nr:antitoxin [Isoptericola sp. BMS4]